MRNKYFIHIGFPKTASTYLQTKVFPLIEEIHFANKEEFVNKWLGYLRSFDTSYFKNQPNILNKLESKYGENQKILISKEGLVGNPFANFSDNTSIANTLKKSFPDAKILIIIRKQDDLLNSLYSLYLKFGGRKKIKDFLFYDENGFAHSGLYTLDNRDPALPPLGVSPHCLNYNNIISNYVEIFGEDNIKILPYELLKLNQNEFFNEIASFLECPNLNIKADKKLVNRNKMGGSVKLMRFVNRFARVDNNPIGFIPIDRIEHKDFSIFTRVWTSFVPQRFKTIKSISNLYNNKSKSLLDENLRKEIMKTHQDSNKKLDDYFDLNLKKFNYYE